MEDERINILMKYVRGEISFAEWIENGVGTGDTELEDIDNGMQVDAEGDGDMQVQTAEAGDSQMNTASSEANNAPPGKLFARGLII